MHAYNVKHFSAEFNFILMSSKTCTIYGNCLRSVWFFLLLLVKMVSMSRRHYQMVIKQWKWGKYLSYSVLTELACRAFYTYKHHLKGIMYSANFLPFFFQFTYRRIYNDYNSMPILLKFVYVQFCFSITNQYSMTAIHQFIRKRQLNFQR